MTTNPHPSEQRVAELADHPALAFKVQSIVLREHTRDTSVHLNRGEHLFIVVDGRAPIDSGHSGPDNVCILTEQFCSWPVVAVKVRTRHVDKWRRLTAADADRMMKRVRDSVASLSNKDQ